MAPSRTRIARSRQVPSLVREFGLMRSLTDLVVERALDDVARWKANGVRVPVAVNMFAPSLCDLELPKRILRSLDERDLSPDLLTIEITEDLLLDDVDRTRQVLDSLRGTRNAGRHRRLRQRLLGARIPVRVADRRGQTRPAVHRPDRGRRACGGRRPRRDRPCARARHDGGRRGRRGL